MNKWGVIISLIIVVILAIFIGVFIFKFTNTLKKDEINNVTTNIVNEVEYSFVNDITIKTDTIEEKISPNATLILKTKYKKCGHIIKEYRELPEELVNLTKEELEKKYDNWEIEKFTSTDIILIKEEEGICDEHFILKEKDGVIAVYKIKDNGNEILNEVTNISIEYLTENDKVKLKQGIKVYSKEELNSILEDFE